MNKYLLNQNTVFNELQFAIAAKLYSEVEKLFEVFMKSGLDDNSLGFWIWDIPNNIELYSPKFRSSLQYSGEHDFPSIPESWMSAILPEDKNKALIGIQKHIETKGSEKYLVNLRYKKKYKGIISVLCQGQVISWNDDQPVIMVGIHMNKSGMFQSTVDKFKSMLDEDVTYSDMINFHINKRVKLKEGIHFTMQSKNSVSWEGICEMEKGTELSIHHHSDYEELFEPISGSVIDLLNNVLITPTKPYLFKKDISHLMYCKSKCLLKISGIYKAS